MFKGSGKPGKLREFHFAKFVRTLYYCMNGTCSESCDDFKFWEINDNTSILETARDTDIVAMKDLYEIVCCLLNGSIICDFQSRDFEDQFCCLKPSHLIQLGKYSIDYLRYVYVYEQESAHGL